MQAPPPSQAEDVSLEGIALRIVSNQGALWVMAAIFAIYLVGNIEQKRQKNEAPVFPDETEKALYEQFKAEQAKKAQAEKDVKINSLEAQIKILEMRLAQLEETKHE